MCVFLGRPLAAVGLAVAVLVCASPSMASSPGQAAPSYDALIARLAQLPPAMEARALSEAANARAQQAGALPNPTIGLEAENVFGTGPYTGFGNADTTVSVTQPLELFGQRRARIDVARSQARAVELQSEQVFWQVAGRLARAYADAEAASRRHGLAAEALTLAEDDARAVAALVKAGREAELRSVQADSEAQAARAALEQARAMSDAALARLAALAMLEGPVDRIEDSLLDRTQVMHRTDVDVPLAVRIAQAEYDTAGHRITMEQRRARPDINATIGARRFRETGDEALTVGLSLSVPLFDRNRGAVRAAYADQRAAQARLAGQRQEAKAERLAAVAILSASDMRAQAMDSGVAAAAEAYRLARIGFDAGRISLLELRSTRAALVSSRVGAVDARLARVLAEIELAGLEGRVPFGGAR